MYSNDASVMRGHHDKSNARSFCKFSAINSMPSSVTLLHPDNDRTVKCGNEWTARIDKRIKEQNGFSIHKSGLSNVNTHFGMRKHDWQRSLCNVISVVSQFFFFSPNHQFDFDTRFMSSSSSYFHSLMAANRWRIIFWNARATFFFGRWVL